MRGGRKNLKRAVEEETLTLQEWESIMQVVSHRGSNLIEVLNAAGEKSLALLPAKFQKSMWTRRGSFVVVDERGRDGALESGRKVTCIVTQVLFFKQVRLLQKSPEWPEIFRKAIPNDVSNGQPLTSTSQTAEESMNSSDEEDDGLPPLEANTNRRRPVKMTSDTESESESDSDS